MRKNGAPDNTPPGKGSLSDCFSFLADFQEELLDALQQQETATFYRQEIELEDKSQILVNIRLKPIVIEGDSQALVLIDDVTEASLNEELLVQSQKLEAIHSLAGGIAHDFNNVLAAISGSAKLLSMQTSKTEAVASEKINKHLNNILKASEKGAVTTKSLATLSGRVSVDLADFSINRVIDEVLSVCRTTMDKDVTINYQQPSEEFHVLGSKNLIEQALLNVLINAYHAMTIMRAAGEETGGTLTVTLQRADSCDASQKLALDLAQRSPGQNVLIHIQDNGVGFSDEQLAQAFVPFYTTKGKNIGTGLGLTMVQNTIAQHQGQITIKSQPGTGTDVEICLPCAAVMYKTEGQQEVDAPPVETDNSECRIKKILLADDNPVIIETLAAGLEVHGFSVTTAANGAELVDTYKQHTGQIDLVITDLEMPIMTGDAAFFEIKAIDPDARVIMTSGFLEDERVQKVLRAGASGFVQKPCNLDILINKINQLGTVK